MAWDFDVIGVGAINADYIVTTPPKWRSQIDETRTLEGKEVVLSESEMDELLASVRVRTVESGGSSLNALRALLDFDLGLRLGFVGVAGASTSPQHSVVTALSGIDTSHVVSSQKPVARCCSVKFGRERQLFTTTGANSDAAAHFRQNRREVLRYLATAKVVHISSFLDAKTESALVPLLEELSAKHPRTKIVVDPGHVWAAQPSAAVQRIMACADYLLLNSLEFELLSGWKRNQDRGLAAERLLARYAPDAVIVLKQAEAVVVYGGSTPEQDYQFRIPEPVEDHRVVDSTGAGDVFAAGLLAWLTSEHLQLRRGVQLGIESAQTKLRSLHRRIPRLATVARHHADHPKAAIPGRSIFIAHGHSRLYKELAALLKADGYSVRMFESRPESGKEITAALRRHLQKTCFAVALFSPEDRLPAGRKGGRARPNVVHEAGLFQGALGFAKVALLVQDGCEVPSNLNGIVRLDFQGDDLSEVYVELRGVLRREGVRPVR